MEETINRINRMQDNNESDLFLIKQGVAQLDKNINIIAKYLAEKR